MLVLSRKQNEKIIIGDCVTLTILKIRGKTVRIGIEAPRDIHVVRGELARDETPESSPVTIEFKSNGSETTSNTPSLRIVTRIDEMDGNPIEAPVDGRMQPPVAQVGVSDRKAQ